MEKAKVVGFIPKLLYRIFLALKEKFDPKPVISNEEELEFYLAILGAN